MSQMGPPAEMTAPDGMCPLNPRTQTSIDAFCMSASGTMRHLTTRICGVCYPIAYTNFKSCASKPPVSGPFPF